MSEPTLSDRIEAIKAIPANEQCLGHFQLAVIVDGEMARAYR